MYSSSTNHFDVIIIGAGLSGMTAAYTLLEKEPALNILVLEAQDRIGGRLLTIPMAIEKEKRFWTFDLGGECVNNHQKDLLKLLKKLDLTVVERNFQNIWAIKRINKNGIFFAKDNSFYLWSVFSRVVLFKFFEKMERMSEKVSLNNLFIFRNWKKFDCISMEDYIVKNIYSRFSRKIIRNFVTITCGVDPKDISALFYFAFCNSVQGISNLTKIDGFILGGAQQICDKIIQKIERKNVLTNQVVLEIERTENDVIVVTDNGTFSCSAAIIAVPPHKVLDICFRPPLPKEKVEILENVVVGQTTRFVVAYKEAFWIANGYSGELWGTTDNLIIYCYDTTIEEKAALAGYINTTKLKTTEKEQITSQVVEQLANFFGEEALAPLGFILKSWENIDDDYYNFNDCYMCCPRIGTMTNYHEFRGPIGRLFWSGTETATRWNGSMNGAVLAGQRAAFEVLYEIRPQSISVEDIVDLRSKQVQINKYKGTWFAYATNWKIIFGIAVFTVLRYYGYKNVIFLIRQKVDLWHNVIRFRLKDLK